jgi:hypothetical protein
METKHGSNRSNAFLWGAIFGALFATLLTTKRGRQIIREMTNLGLELFEDFVEKRTKKNHESRIMNQEEIAEEAKEDIESEITEVETQPETAPAASVESASEPAKNGDGHGSKKRLFKGIRRK